MQQGNLLDTKIEFLKGIGPARADLLRSEMNIHTFHDLLMQYPRRYIDKTQFHQINQLNSDSGTVQIKGILRRLQVEGQGRKKRLTARFRDETGAIDLIWFAGISWLQKALQNGKEYVVYGQVSVFNKKLNIAHPEMELVNEDNAKAALSFAPVYAGTEKLNAKGFIGKKRRDPVFNLIQKVNATNIPENLPVDLLKKLKLPPRWKALKDIHFPSDKAALVQARNRLKFEELFFLQLGLLQLKNRRQQAIKGYNFKRVGEIFNQFFKEKLPFELTGAQKRVVKEIRRDMGTGRQMNRLLQGDVGSGKTMVALLCMLIALDNGYQACMMAPTEILAQQHLQSITEYLEGMDVKVGYLSGTVKGKARRLVLEALEAGEIDIIIGTHALLEDPVVFKNLGLAITDEQHRFGVVQRARLWKKSNPFPPHVLVMTATPIPRTLALTLYGDLDVSVIDELPPGRKQVQTRHFFEKKRPIVIEFIKKQIAEGRQVYVVYPLIKESEKLDLKNLEEGYGQLLHDFPIPDYQISVVHGQMKAEDKDFEMQRFVEGTTQIMVATTVIEVGVNVPNASVMVIENTERFGLSQLHQLRGRVGRGADQAHCILMSSYKLSNEGKERIQTMLRTTNGFEIAEADLKLRGPGDIDGLRQSGMLDLKIADLSKDQRILQTARYMAQQIIEDDPALENPKYAGMKRYLDQHIKKNKGWGRIS